MAVLTAGFYLQLGWSSTLVPALLLRLEADFNQPDAGFAVLYLLWSIGSTIGAFLGGWATERLGRRVVYAAALLVWGACLIAQPLLPSWTLFVLLGVPRSIGGGIIDGGGTGLIIDLYPEARGRALNAVHLFYAFGATVAPFVVAGLGAAGVSWQTLLIATGIVTMVQGVLAAAAPMPDGRHRGGSSADAAARGETGGRRLAMHPAILALAAAAFLYVAAEIGVSSWVVRFFADAPAAVATASLGLFWGGLMLGRLTSSVFADRFDHVRLGVLASGSAGVALVAAVLVPVLPVSVALFAVVGFMQAPVFPLVMAVAGERFPSRAAAVSGIVTGAAISGSIVLPPIMGFLSAALGMGAVMLLAALVSAACAGALAIAGRLR